MKRNLYKLLQGFVKYLCVLIISACAFLPCRAQTSGPYIPNPSSVHIIPLTNQQPVVVRVTVTLPQPAPCYYVTNWGQVISEGNLFSVDAQFWYTATICPLSLSGATTYYNLGTLSPGEYMFAFSSWGTPLVTLSFSVPFPRLPLGITLEGGQAQLIWPTNPPGYLLETSTSLSTAGWAALTTTPDTSGTNFTVTIGVSSDQQYFRLHHP